MAWRERKLPISPGQVSGKRRRDDDVADEVHRYATRQVPNAVLYDITVQVATTLAAAIITRRRSATTAEARNAWDRHLRAVDRQRDALRPDDRTDLVFHQLQWRSQLADLRGTPEPQGV